MNATRHLLGPGGCQWNSPLCKLGAIAVRCEGRRGSRFQEKQCSLAVFLSPGSPLVSTDLWYLDLACGVDEASPRCSCVVSNQQPATARVHGASGRERNDLLCVKLLRKTRPFGTMTNRL